MMLVDVVVDIPYAEMGGVATWMDPVYLDVISYLGDVPGICDRRHIVHTIMGGIRSRDSLILLILTLMLEE